MQFHGFFFFEKKTHTHTHKRKLSNGNPESWDSKVKSFKLTFTCYESKPSKWTMEKQNNQCYDREGY